MTDQGDAVGKPRLLYIDDDRGLSRLVQKELGRHGYDVTLAPDGDAGLELLNNGDFDIVALDHYMPGRDGLDVLPDILDRPAPAPVVYVTGAQEGRIAVAALRAGAADYVIKDVSEDFTSLLRSALEDALLRRRLQRENEEAQEQVRLARDRAEAMLREVNHRVGNSLQLVSSLMSLQQRHLSDDGARAALRQAQAGVRQAQAAREIAEQYIRTVEVGRGGQQAGVSGAEAQLRLARIDLANTLIRAPERGRLSEVGVRVGQYVTAGSQLMFLVPPEVWVIANFKEAQTARIAVGQPASFTVDALNNARIRGHVERISPAAGSEFAVLKSDNATGNFTKVPQRIAVRIRIDPGQRLAARLRPGMSVQARVDVDGAPAVQ